MDPTSTRLLGAAGGAGSTVPLDLSKFAPAADLGLYTFSLGNGSVFFNSAGNLVTVKSGAGLWQFRAKTAHNLTGAVGTSSCSLVANYDCHISEDGTRLYELVFGSNGNFAVKVSTFTTPWDLSTRVDNYTHTPTYNPAYNTTRNGIALSPDGTKLFIADQSTYLYYWTLTTPWDVRTATGGNSFTFSFSYLQGLRSLAVSSDGLRIYLNGTNGQAYPMVVQYTLTTAWNPGGGRSFTAHQVGGVSQLNYPQGAFGISQNGRTVYWSLSVGNRSTGRNENITTVSNDLATAWNLTGWSCRGTTGNVRLDLSSNWSTSMWVYDVRAYAMRADGTQFYFTKGYGSGFELYRGTLSTPYDLSTMGITSIYSHESNISGYGMWLRPDGMGFYVGNKYFTTTTAWNFSNPTLAHTYATAGNYPQFDKTGTKYYLATGSSIVQSTLTTPWNISTGTVTGTLSGVSGNYRIASDGGSFVMIAGDYSEIVRVYSLSSPWSIATATLKSSESQIGNWTGLLELCKDDTLLIRSLNQEYWSYYVVTPFRYYAPIALQALP